MIDQPPIIVPHVELELLNRSPQNSLRCRGSVTQRAVRFDLIVVLPPVFDQHLGRKERAEECHVEKLVP